MSKSYKILIRLIDDERVEVMVKYDNLLNLLEDLKGERITFVSKTKPDRQSFTIFTHQIKKIEYKATQYNPLDKTSLYLIFAS